MQEVFVTKIKTENCPIVGDIEIPLNDTSRKHLIITGKNGSGKTTLLKAINKSFQRMLIGAPPISKLNEFIEVYENSNDRLTLLISVLKDKENKNTGELLRIQQAEREIIEQEKYIKDLTQDLNGAKKAQIFFSDTDYLRYIKDQNFILAFFEDKRKNKPSVPKAIERVDLTIDNPTETNTLHKKFIAYMVRLRTTYLNEKDKAEEKGNEENRKKAEEIKKWFEKLENTFKDLFQKEDLRLEYEDEELNYKIKYENRSFGLNELSDGYSSLIAILAELILRMEAKGFKAYDMQGVALIDEVETHLHLDLQKKVLPFLCGFFPKIQFIVTTHSPFVLSSLENAVICDLENRIIIQEGVSEYSYEALVDGYFDVEKYSNEIMKKVQRFQDLIKRRKSKALQEDEILELNSLEHHLQNIPSFQNEELSIRIKRLLEELL